MRNKFTDNLFKLINPKLKKAVLAEDQSLTEMIIANISPEDNPDVARSVAALSYWIKFTSQKAGDLTYWCWRVQDSFEAAYYECALLPEPERTYIAVEKLSLKKEVLLSYIKEWHKVGVECLYPYCSLYNFYEEAEHMPTEEEQQYWDMFEIDTFEGKTHEPCYVGRDNSYQFSLDPDSPLPIHPETDLIVPSNIFDFYSKLEIPFDGYLIVII